MSDEDKKISEKRKELRRLQKICINDSKDYKKRYKRLKWISDVVEVAHTSLNMSAVALTLSGFGIPPLLIASACCAGAGMVLSQGQKSYRSQTRLTNYNVCVTQYDSIAREINSVLLRNHMSSKDYQEYIDDIHAKLDLIDDSRLL